MDTFSWQQIVLHKQRIRQYIHNLLDSSGSESCKGLKKKITRAMGIYYTKKRNHLSHNALFFFIHVPKNHPIPPMLLSYGRCPSRWRHIGRNAKRRFHTNMEVFAKIRKITRTLPHSKAPFEEHQNLTYEDAHEMPSPESCLKETYTCSHIYPLHWLAV
jgi:hypothetical protein